MKSEKKSYVFNFFLKMFIDGEDLTSLGKLFHNFGAHAENALSPKVVVLDLGALRTCWLLERKFR